jgi:osmotically inducible protein OsmC
MPTRSAEAVWNGDLMDGDGRMSFGSGAFEGPYSYESRMEEGPGSNPEELIGAAHAGCFAMALSGELTQAGHPPNSIRTNARVSFNKADGGWAITGVELSTEGDVPGIDETAFIEHAGAAKENCPVSKALAGVEITLNASLAGG